jgi:hypothetical protein
MMHLHWPYWASHVIDDVEHQGELQTMGLLLVVTMLIGAFLFALFALIVAIVHVVH